ncbi:MAG: hypothetical protein ACI3XD_04830 [Oscillospiraceae bacterium]
MSRRKKKKKSKAQEWMEYLMVVVICIAVPILPLKLGFETVICTPENTEACTIVVQESYFRTIDWLKGRSSRFFLRSTDGDLYTMNEQIAHTWYDEFFSEPGTELAVSLLYDDGRGMEDPETGERASAYIVSASRGDRVVFDLDTENDYRHANKTISLVVGIVVAIPCWGLLLLGVVYGILNLIVLMMERSKRLKETQKR